MLRKSRRGEQLLKVAFHVARPCLSPRKIASTGLYTSSNMTLYQSNSKRIFAPGDSKTSSQASQFKKGSLELKDLDSNPLIQFHTWFEYAQTAGVYHPETVTLSTAELPSGRVSARMVYLKELNDQGFVIYSNFGTSRKAADLASNPHAALTFWWQDLERQVRVEGRAERMTNEESQVYYDTRIRGSRIGAWASQQSKVLKDRKELEDQVQEVEKRFGGKDEIPVPEFWGGLRIVPDVVEFWQGRESRLHDRFKFTRDESAQHGWRAERLSP
jgi:pyridoxamine 5'-phosphate oxidase